MDLYNRKGRFEHILLRLEKVCPYCKAPLSQECGHGAQVKQEFLALSEANKRVILEYKDYRLGRESRHVSTIEKDVRFLVRIANWLDQKPLKEIADADMSRLKGKVRELGIKDFDFMKVIKHFLKWVYDGDYPKWLNKDRVGWKKVVKNPEEMLTSEDFLKLIETAEHPRDKAFIAVLCESGMRIGELLNLHVGDVRFERSGAALYLPDKEEGAKTGFRRVLLVWSTPYLSSWMQSHPYKKDAKSPLWTNYGTTKHNQPLGYGGACKLLDVAGNRAGIKKPLNPHHVRHSAATIASQFLTDAQMRIRFGWTPESSMPGIYTHLSGKDIDSAICRMNGVEINEDELKDRIPQLRKCARCKAVNPPTADKCDTCGWDLSVREDELVTQLEGKLSTQDNRIKNLEKMLTAVVDGRVRVEG